MTAPLNFLSILKQKVLRNVIYIPSSAKKCSGHKFHHDFVCIVKIWKPCPGVIFCYHDDHHLSISYGGHPAMQRCTCPAYQTWGPRAGITPHFNTAQLFLEFAMSKIDLRQCNTIPCIMYNAHAVLLVCPTTRETVSLMYFCTFLKLFIELVSYSETVEC